MSAVAESPGAHPGELIAAHCSSDAPVGDHAHRYPARLDQGHSPGRSAQPTPIPPLAIDVDNEPVGSTPRPADDAAVHALEHRWRHHSGAADPSQCERDGEHSTDLHPSIYSARVDCPCRSRSTSLAETLAADNRGGAAPARGRLQREAGTTKRRRSLRGQCESHGNRAFGRSSCK
jgi:hypothetical protein